MAGEGEEEGEGLPAFMRETASFRRKAEMAVARRTARAKLMKKEVKQRPHASMSAVNFKADDILHRSPLQAKKKKKKKKKKAHADLANGVDADGRPRLGTNDLLRRAFGREDPESDDPEAAGSGSDPVPQPSAAAVAKPIAAWLNAHDAVTEASPAAAAVVRRRSSPKQSRAFAGGMVTAPLTEERLNALDAFTLQERVAQLQIAGEAGSVVSTAMPLGSTFTYAMTSVSQSPRLPVAAAPRAAVAEDEGVAAARIAPALPEAASVVRKKAASGQPPPKAVAPTPSPPKALSRVSRGSRQSIGTPRVEQRLHLVREVEVQRMDMASCPLLDTCRQGFNQTMALQRLADHLRELSREITDADMSEISGYRNPKPATATIVACFVALVEVPATWDTLDQDWESVRSAVKSRRLLPALDTFDVRVGVPLGKDVVARVRGYSPDDVVSVR